MKIAIYQTSDVHGYIYPTNYVKEAPLGLLKIGSYMKEDEKNYDGALKIDCGDLIQGSALANYLSKKKLEKNPIIECMEAIGYNGYVIGNHEFNFGTSYLARSYAPVANKVINANIEGLPFETKPYEIFDLNGYKIACIGVTTKYIPNWEQPMHIEGLSFSDPVEMYGKYEEEMKAQADFIIVAYHGGFERSLDEEMVPTESLTKENQASELLQKFDSINMILSGHQHRSFITKINGVVCSQPLHNGQNFTKAVVDTETGEVEYELVDVKHITTPIEPELESLFTEIQAELEEYLDQKIGHFSQSILVEDVFEARLKGHPFINFMHQIQLDVSGADFSVFSIFDGTIGFSKEVSIREVLINYPYANTLKVLRLKGSKFKEAIEKSATYFVVEDGKVQINREFLFPKVQNYNYDMFGGLSYEIDLNKPFGERVVSMTIGQEAIDMEKEYTVVLSNYRASNVSLYTAYKDAEVVKEITQDISELIIEYIEKTPCIEVSEEKNYKIYY